MATLKLTDVHKSYGATEVIKGVNIDIADGEFAVFVGPSGCGKSTLLRLIAGLEDITSGELRIGGRIVNDLQPKDRGVAMVFQSYAIFPHMTVRENIAFGLTIRRENKARIEEKVAEAARMLHMEELLDRRPSQLSGGQRQRVAIGRAIVREPSVFLFDEPLSNLDAALRMNTRMEIGRLHENLGTTMIYVTHDQIEAMTLADKIVVLRDGEVMQAGRPMDLYHHPENLFVAGFLGAPAMNFMTVEVKEVKNGTAIVGNASLDPIGVPTGGRNIRGGSTAILGVRPQYLTPTPPEDGMLHGTVSMTERLGNETVMNLILRDGSGIIAAIAEDRVFSEETEIGLTFDPMKAHIFNESP